MLLKFAAYFLALFIRFKILLSIAVLCLIFKIQAQESFKSIQPIEFTIKSELYPSSSNEKQVLSSLAVNNLKNINHVKIHFKGDMFLSIQMDDDGHPFAYIKMQNQKLSGEIYFRDFLIDTLLTPKVFDGKLLIRPGNNKIIEIPIEMLMSGGVLGLDMLENYNMEFDDLQVEIEVSKFYFTDQQLLDFMRKANVINSYYSYNEVLDLVIKRYSGNQISRDKSSSSTFIAWHKLNRVNKFIAKKQFIEELQLESNDPLHFLEKWDRSLRLEKRATTLLEKELAKGRRGKLLDRNLYCKNYVGISNNYILLSKNYPPNTVSAFNELVRIFPVDEDLKNTASIAAFYDVFKITGVPLTAQLTYNNFVQAADSTLKKQEYLNALNLIRNASEIETFFDGVKRSPEFSEVYANSLNGLMSSFLKVSVLAYKSRNFKIAKRYYQQAQQIYDANADLIGDDFRVKYSFQEFVEKQIELAGMLMDDAYFEEAISLLDQARYVGEQNELEIKDLAFETAYKKGYGGIYEVLIDSVEYYIEKENKNKGLNALLYSAEFENAHDDYLVRDERVTSYAQILYENYMNLGVSKLHGNKPENAINYLLEARKLNDMFLLNKDFLIDSVINQAIIPVVLQTVKKAEFEVWANRFSEAYTLKEEAMSLMLSYNLSENKEVKNALAGLKKKMEYRICLDAQYKVNNTCRIFENRINSSKFDEAQNILLNIEELLSERQDCDINSSLLDSLIKNFKPLFQFRANMNSFMNQFDSTPFSELIIQYAKLRTDFITNKLEHYLNGMPSLKEMMQEYGGNANYFDAIDYYINKEDYLNAFAYLDLLRLNHIDSKNTNEYQKIIGHHICNNHPDKEAFILDLTKNNSWYKKLQTACLKN